ncbi:MAG: UDP-N-acetylmuramoyl-L-alanine--D-glutamate ligase [Armatimonadetes bacterium]|nr:UDP-N-acetylmuramoyl-L-alanine--D-glutamate ligase [Armatimonadota bacterium]
MNPTMGWDIIIPPHRELDEMRESEFCGKTVAVVGMARTGMAAAEVLTDLGAEVVLYDQKPASELDRQLEEAKGMGVRARPGTSDVDLDGVDMLVPSPGVSAASPVFGKAARLGVEVLSEIEIAYRISQSPIIAVTGTNGKTTTTVLIGRIMEADGRKSYIAGNVAAGDIKLPLVLAAYRASPDAVIVAEISTFQLEWISSFRPKVAILLNIGTDHMDRHSPEEYASLKARIFEYQTSEDFAVINLDNEAAVSKSYQVSSQKLCFSRLTEVEQGGFIEDGLVKVRIGGREVEVCSLDDICASGNLPGTHSEENVLAASCAAVAVGARPESIARAVRGFAGIEHRMERVAVIDGVSYVNNSMCTNPDAFARSVASVEGRPIIIAGGKHKGGDLSLVAKAVKDYAKYLILIGTSAPEIEKAVQSTGFLKMTRAGSMEEAVSTGAAVAEPGDTVILAPGCASFDMFSGFEERGQVFKDIVRRRASAGWGRRADESR